MSKPLVASALFSIFVFIVVGFFSANFQYAAALPYPFAGDFLQEYVGGWLVLHGDHTRFYDFDYARQLEHDPAVTGYQWEGDRWFPMIYPPFWYLLVAPLALLPIRLAALLWLAGMIAALTGSLLLLARHFPQRIILPWALPLSVLFLPSLESLQSGQKASLILLILTATFVLLDRRRPFAAGLVFGLIAFKPQLALVIGVALLLKRQWAFVAGSLATVLGLVGLCLIVGVDVSRQYFDLSLRLGDYIQTIGYPVERMHCWYGFVRLLLPDRPLAEVKLVTAVLDLATIVALARILWGPLRYGEPAFAVQFSALVLVTLLLSPHLLTYDLTPLLLPMVLLIVTVTQSDAAMAQHGRPVGWLLAALFVLGAASVMIAEQTHVQLSVLAIFALLLWLARRPWYNAENVGGTAA